MIHIWKTSTLVLAGALAFVVAAGDNTARADGGQPHMQAALTALQTAQAQLKSATPDKGGHRQAAIEATERAIAQVQKGIEFDKTHPGDKKSVDATGDEAPALE